jgi:hypothetical protein
MMLFSGVLKPAVPQLSHKNQYKKPFMTVIFLSLCTYRAGSKKILQSISTMGEVDRAAVPPPDGIRTR